MSKGINKEELFNLVAPIHIYFNADLMFKNEANEGLKKLKKLKLDNMVLDYLDEDDFSSKKLDQLDNKLYWRVYNQLFEELVLKEFEDFEPSVDTYGAKCFKYQDKIYLDGDSFDCYPFYTDYVTLTERLNDLSKEL